MENIDESSFPQVLRYFTWLYDKAPFMNMFPGETKEEVFKCAKLLVQRNCARSMNPERLEEWAKSNEMLYPLAQLNTEDKSDPDAVQYAAANFDGTDRMISNLSDCTIVGAVNHSASAIVIPNAKNLADKMGLDL